MRLTGVAHRMAKLDVLYSRDLWQEHAKAGDLGLSEDRVKLIALPKRRLEALDRLPEHRASVTEELPDLLGAVRVLERGETVD